MARKKGCCGCLFSMLAFVVILGVAGYFAGNYFISQYIGDGAKFIDIGANSWGDVFDIYGLLKDDPDTGKFINPDSVPNTENGESAEGKLIDLGFPKDADGNIDIDKLFAGEVDLAAVPENPSVSLTGGELAALLNKALLKGLTELNIGIEGIMIEQIRFEYQDSRTAKMTVTFSLPLDILREKLGAFAFIIGAEKAYITSESVITITDGTEAPPEQKHDTLACSAAGGGLSVNDLTQEQSGKLISALLSLTGGGESLTAAGLSENIGKAVADAFNKIKCEKSFTNADPSALTLSVSGI